MIYIRRGLDSSISYLMSTFVYLALTLLNDSNFSTDVNLPRVYLYIYMHMNVCVTQDFMNMSQAFDEVIIIIMVNFVTIVVIIVTGELRVLDK